jgi:hypothetical protein
MSLNRQRPVQSWRLRAFLVVAAAAFGVPVGVTMTTSTQPQSKKSPVETAIVTTVHVSFRKLVLGRMPLVSDTTVAKAGTIEFIITNNFPKLKHTIFLAQIEDSFAGLQTKGFGSTVDTSASKLKYLAKFSNIDPRQTVMLTMDLWPGRYIIFCSRKHHYSKEGDVRFEIDK